MGGERLSDDVGANTLRYHPYYELDLASISYVHPYVLSIINVTALLCRTYYKFDILVLKVKETAASLRNG